VNTEIEKFSRMIFAFICIIANEEAIELALGYSAWQDRLIPERTWCIKKWKAIVNYLTFYERFCEFKNLEK